MGPRRAPWRGRRLLSAGHVTVNRDGRQPETDFVRPAVPQIQVRLDFTTPLNFISSAAAPCLSVPGSDAVSGGRTGGGHSGCGAVSEAVGSRLRYLKMSQDSDTPKYAGCFFGRRRSLSGCGAAGRPRRRAGAAVRVAVCVRRLTRFVSAGPSRCLCPPADRGAAPPGRLAGLEGAAWAPRRWRRRRRTAAFPMKRACRFLGTSAIMLSAAILEDRRVAAEAIRAISGEQSCSPRRS